MQYKIWINNSLLSWLIPQYTDSPDFLNFAFKLVVMATIETSDNKVKPFQI